MFDFPNQESREQSDSLKMDSGTITQDLLIIAAVSLMYFFSFVSAVFVCLTGLNLRPVGSGLVRSRLKNVYLRSADTLVG